MAEVPSAVSFVYTKEEPRPAVQYSRYGALPFTFVTLLLPYPGRQAPAVAIRELTVTGEHDPIAVEVTGPGFVDVLFAGVDVGPVKGPGFEAVGLAGLLRKGADGADVGITCVAERGIHANLRARWEAQ